MVPKEMISIIDYDAGNIKSVEKALHFLGEDAVITSDRDTILRSDGAILPGVGAFGNAMEKINSRGLDDTIHEYISLEKPFLGICLGLQLMFGSSDESPGVAGLSILDGKILRIPSSYHNKSDGTTSFQKVPHMGWNSIRINPESRLLKGINDEAYVYFVHSYYLDAANEEDVAATTEYGIKLDVAVEHGNIMATQFHPEKSSDIGLKILRNFIEITED